eukprot:108972-Prorocentrum_lima.AAC.1
MFLFVLVGFCVGSVSGTDGVLVPVPVMHLWVLVAASLVDGVVMPVSSSDGVDVFDAIFV